jgi:predicted RNA-binding Zn ribbon-like protein
MPPRIVAPLVGEPLPLDLVNTRPQADRGQLPVLDSLGTIEGLQQWLLVESDRLPHVRVTEATRLGVVSMRREIGVALDGLVAGQAPPSSAIDALNRALRRSPSVTQLRWDAPHVHGSGSIETIRTGDDDARLLGALAEAAVEYLASDLAAQTRRCEAPDCELLFFPTHPRRRWCSPSVCGNRTRVARYYERHKV